MHGFFGCCQLGSAQQKSCDVQIWTLSKNYYSVGSDNINQDYQRMMVDPMFMIGQNLRSFLTTVTPTAVALKLYEFL